jgi:hypothetical protein
MAKSIARKPVTDAALAGKVSNMTLLSEDLLSPALSSNGGEGAFPLPAKWGEGYPFARA